jgi:pimeloyl-ACP methyl ester carboxylesterase
MRYNSRVSEPLREEMSMFIGVNGIQLFYTKTGQGRPLLMVHGNGEDHTIFDEAIDVLKEHYTCYAVDSRGHGKSSPCREFHYKDMAADMIAFMTELDLTDVAFYGFSDGGIIGLLAAMHSARITHLIVSGANISTKGCKLSFRLLLRGMSIGKRDPMIELMQKEPDIDPAQLSAIRVPTLVLAGSKDLIRESETRLIAESIPGARLRILKGEKHGSYIVHSTKIAAIIEEELKRA